MKTDTIKRLGWLGTIASVTGSFLVAFGVMFLGYTLFIVGSGAWLYVARQTKDKALGTMNTIFLCSNIIGIIRSIL